MKKILGPFKWKNIGLSTVTILVLSVGRIYNNKDHIPHGWIYFLQPQTIQLTLFIFVYNLQNI